MKRTLLIVSALLMVAGCGGRAGGGDDHDAGSTGDAAHDGALQQDGPHQQDGAHPGDGPYLPDGEGPLDVARPDDSGAQVGIACGQYTCAAGTDFCCVTGSAPAMNCYPVDTVGPHCDFGARCDGPEDCGGGSCCGPSGAVNQTWCYNGSSCPSGQKLCHTTDDCGVTGEICCYSIEWGWPHSVCTAGAVCPS